MSFWEVLVLGIALSMDAFAVALCKGLSMKQFSVKNALVIGGFFGFFQAFMPLMGWLLGTRLVHYIEAYDHWVAFLLLAIVGGKMIYDAVKEMRQPPEEQQEQPEFKLKYGELLILAIATSIDALAVGLSFAFLNTGAEAGAAGSLSIWTAVITIGITTFIISFFGVMIGNKFGNKFEAKAQIAGGIVLILIGLRILLEHMLG